MAHFRALVTRTSVMVLVANLDFFLLHWSTTTSTRRGRLGMALIDGPSYLCTFEYMNICFALNTRLKYLAREAPCLRQYHFSQILHSVANVSCFATAIISSNELSAFGAYEGVDSEVHIVLNMARIVTSPRIVLTYLMTVMVSTKIAASQGMHFSISIIK